MTSLDKYKAIARVSQKWDTYTIEWGYWENAYPTHFPSSQRCDMCTYLHVHVNVSAPTCTYGEKCWGPNCTIHTSCMKYIHVRKLMEWHSCSIVHRPAARGRAGYYTRCQWQANTDTHLGGRLEEFGATHSMSSTGGQVKPRKPTSEACLWVHC